MDRSQRRGQTPLEVTVSLEPTRLAADHLMDAYRQIVPPQGQRWKMGTVPEGEAAAHYLASSSELRRSSS